MNSLDQSSPPKKTYKEALLTPTNSPNITPNNSPNISPANSPDKTIFMIREEITGVIDKRLKWYLNYDHDDRMCYKCKKGLEWDECNSFYIVYAEKYKNIFDQYKIKVYNNKDQNNKILYCDKCKYNIEKIFKEEKNESNLSSLIL
jgi:hypothetical protein